MATYPAAVHSYAAHRDYVDYILADHVNSLQDEVTAIQQVIGVNPNHWTYIGDANFTNLGDLSAHYNWNTLRDRVDVLQAHVVRLERLEGIRITAYPASQRGPVVAIRNPGQVILPSPVQWSTYDLSVADFDSDNAFTGGSSLACPKTGWWTFSATVWTDVPDGSPGTAHTVSNRILVADSPVAAHSSVRQWGSGGQHLINVSYSGPWNAGDLLFVQSQNFPTPAGAGVWSHMQLSATYVRETV